MSIKSRVYLIMSQRCKEPRPSPVCFERIMNSRETVECRLEERGGDAP